MKETKQIAIDKAEHKKYILEGMSGEHTHVYQVLTNFGTDGYDFYYAYELPKWILEDFDEDLGEMAKQFDHLQIPAGQYLVCETERCEYPTELEDELRRKAVSEWLPSSGYELRDAPEIGVIHWFWEEGNEKVNNSRYCELWIPIVKNNRHELRRRLRSFVHSGVLPSVGKEYGALCHNHSG